MARSEIKPIALEFKKLYPEMFRDYAKRCRYHLVETGKIDIHIASSPSDPHSPRHVMNFPTKRHWRNPSRIEWIEQGLQDLVRVLRHNVVRSVAIPALGSTNGGLDWEKVKPLIVEAFRPFPEISVEIYEPH